ncbi:MAG: SsrA-binding protein SmpB [Bacteroidota bacterium]
MTEPAVPTEKLVCTNRKARHEYTILDSFEAGLVLTGTEVKSLRRGTANIAEGHAEVRGREIWLRSVHISPYEQGSYANVDPLRDRKLLLHKREIARITTRVAQRGLTLIPLRLYFKNKLAKVTIGVAQGKRAYDRRQEIAKRDAERSLRRQYAR